MLRLWVTLNFDLWVTMFIKFGGACQTHPISPSVLSTRAGRRVATVLEIAYQNLSKIHWHRHLLIPRNLTIVPRPSASFYAGTLLNAQPKTSRCHHPKHPNSEALRDQLWRKKYWAPGRFWPLRLRMWETKLRLQVGWWFAKSELEKPAFSLRKVGKLPCLSTKNLPSGTCEISIWML